MDVTITELDVNFIFNSNDLGELEIENLGSDEFTVTASDSIAKTIILDFDDDYTDSSGTYYYELSTDGTSLTIKNFEIGIYEADLELTKQ